MRRASTGFVFVGLMLALVPSVGLAEGPPTHLPPPDVQANEQEPVNPVIRPVAREPLFLCPSALMTGAVQQTHPPLVPVPPGMRPFAEHAGPFEAGTWSVEANVGYGEMSSLGPVVPGPFEFVATHLRVGYMLTCPSDHHALLDGNWEALLDLTTAPVTNGFADIIVGPSALLRYNLVQPGRCVVPYFQFGAGLVYSDGHEDQVQEALGQEWEYLLTAGAGLRVQLDDNWSVDAVFDYYHVCNGGQARRNAGLNCFSGGIGLRYSFPSSRCKCRE